MTEARIQTVYLVRLGAFPAHIEHAIARAVRGAFECETATLPESMDISFALDGQREQYYSTQILHELDHLARDFHDRVLGLTQEDLFIPILTYVFGEAFLDRPAAIVSTHRLCPTFYGLPRNPELLQQRAGIEAVHEIGHTLGLVHCPDYACAMHASHSADEIDLKHAVLCQPCGKSRFI